jgi:prevent-host-death family protein
MKVLEISKATASLADYANEVSNEPMVLTTNGKPVAALLSIADVDVESLSLSSNPEFLAILAESRARLKAEGGISSQEMWRRLGLMQ